MADVKHTRSPLQQAWRAIQEARGWLNTDRPEAKTNALVALNSIQDDPGLPAALCAEAAPDLLEALQAFVSPWDGDSAQEIEAQTGLATSVRIEKARAAIAKATASAPECTCPAKDMPFGRCCKATGGAARATEGSV